MSDAKNPPECSEVLKLLDFSGCKVWPGVSGVLGYCTAGTGRKYAHRIIYELFVGPIPPGYVIDHLCRNTKCVNPLHLQAVTNRENILRGTAPHAKASQKTHCNNGHPFDENNTGRKMGAHGHLVRYCKECRHIRDLKRRPRLIVNGRRVRLDNVGTYSI